jgi:hypothetical protein
LLIEQLTKAWRAREADTPLEPYIAFTDDGLILGAGTRLTASRETCRVSGGQAEALRLEALVVLAYGQPLPATARTHLQRALIHWADGDDALAAMHFAHTGLGRLPDPREAARKLFMAEALLAEGLTPDELLRAYNPEEPRVDPGNGVESGRWTAGGSHAVAAQATGRAVEQTAATAARRATTEVAERVTAGVLARLAPELLGPLGDAVTLLPAAAVFGATLLAPAPNPTADWTNVPGAPGLRYRRSLWEPQWEVQYRDAEGQDHTSVLYSRGNTLLDGHGDEVGRVLPGGGIALDLNEIAPDAVDTKERELCPFPTKDKYGRGPGTVSKAYEDQIKAIVNPTRPTPSGIGYALPNSSMKFGSVTFDDCEHSTGTMIEAKGPSYTDMLRNALERDTTKKDYVAFDALKELLTQSGNQVEAARATGQAIRWYFADVYAADYARERFAEADQGREKIEIVVVPALRRGK